MAGGRLSAHKAKLALRRYYALELRIQGGSFRQIAQQIASMPEFSDDYCEAMAYRDVHIALAELAKETQEKALHLRQLELQRLESLIPTLMQASKRGDWAALDRLLNVIQMRIRLMGLDRIDNQTGEPGVNPLSGLVAIIAESRLKLMRQQKGLPEQPEQAALPEQNADV
jgi:hypothetical protein